MTPLTVTADLDADPWEDLGPHPVHGRIERAGLLHGTTAADRPLVALAVRLADGSHVVASTTWEQLYGAVRELVTSPVVAAALDAHHDAHLD